MAECGCLRMVGNAPQQMPPCRTSLFITQVAATTFSGAPSTRLARAFSEPLPGTAGKTADLAPSRRHGPAYGERCRTQRRSGTQVLARGAVRCCVAVAHLRRPPTRRLFRIDGGSSRSW